MNGRSIGIIGGGTAGLFAALALKKRYPECRVSVIESSTIPVIGVGEATTTLMPPFLHRELGIDPVDLYREVRPTWKLGIKFDWGMPGDSYFTYPFGETDTLEAEHHEGDLLAQSFNSLLMVAGRSPLLRSDRGEIESLLPRLKFAYHLHNAPFVAFLSKTARDRGVEHVDAVIESAETDGASIASLKTRDGRELRFDVYVDASGFRSFLMEKTLGSEFVSYASSLFCDRAIVADVPQRGAIEPYTLAATMDAGWCWRIPVEGVDHRGYVHSSAFLSEEQAIEEMRAKNPGMAEPWVVRFRSGRHRDFVRGNVFAIGNAYGFVEPLESTALHMVLIELQYLTARLDGLLDDETVNAKVGAHWDYLRWFLAIHYRFNRKLDTPFWRRCREEVDIGPLSEEVERHRRGEPVSPMVSDPAFGGSGLLIMLLGQKVGPGVAGRVPRDAWKKRLAAQRSAVARALPQAEALEVLRARPDLLQELLREPSWLTSDHEVVTRSAHGLRLPHERSPGE